MHASPNEEMAALWNGVSGKAWVDEQALLDHTYQPIEIMLASEVAARGVRSVLDVGCGAGATSLAVARSLDGRGHVTGIDISEPLLAVARARARQSNVNVRFVCADAQTHAFEPPTFDMIISRFGVMFFDDPVAAFANLHRAATPGGGMQLVAFRSAAENEFMTTAERAAAPLLPKLPARRPDAPGQFALADRGRVQQMLLDGGWAHVRLAPIDVPCAFPAADLERYITRLGPLGSALRGADDATRARVIGRVRMAFEPFVHGSQVQFIAACWMITARAARTAAQCAESDRK